MAWRADWERPRKGCTLCMCARRYAMYFVQLYSCKAVCVYMTSTYDDSAAPFWTTVTLTATFSRCGCARRGGRVQLSALLSCSRSCLCTNHSMTYRVLYRLLVVYRPSRTYGRCPLYRAVTTAERAVVRCSVETTPRRSTRPPRRAQNQKPHYEVMILSCPIATFTQNRMKIT